MTKARILADYVAGGTTAAEFDYMDGVTSNVQTQLTAKAPLASPAFTGIVTAPSLVLTPTGTAPATTEGAIYYDSTSDTVKVRNASAWKTLNNVEATGGTITSYSSGGVGYKVHTFLTSGTFTALTPLTVDYLVVAGGGAGGYQIGGGGGAGGFRTDTGFAVTAQAYTITVGAGGATQTGDNSAEPHNGSDSVFSSITSTGGGGGGSNGNGQPGDGGSGGGCGEPTGTQPIGLGNTPSTNPSQGNNGGIVNGNASGGGGGAGAVGVAGVNSATGGNGGVGVASSISGTSTYYAGGGGGGYYTADGTARGTGGNGGGGTGSTGSANTGGGGAGSSYSAENNGFAGGSGIVIIRYEI